MRAAVGHTAKPQSFGLVFVVVGLGIAMVNLDLFVCNVALPSIGRAFHGADLANLSWVLNAYAIIFAALLVPAGRLADRIGRRAAFLAGVVIFALSSAWCALSGSVWELVAARVVQAAGGALLMPASLGLLLAVAPPAKRAAAIRGWTAIGGLAAALGPVIGGLLVELSWHWVFLINLPVAAITLAAGWRVLPRGLAGHGGPTPGTSPPGHPRRRRAHPCRRHAGAVPGQGRCLGLDVGPCDRLARRLGRPVRGVLVAVIPAPRAGHRAAPAPAARVRHRDGGRLDLRHGVRRDAAARHPVVPGRLGLVGPAAGLAVAPGPLMVPFLSVSACRSPGGSAPARSPRQAAPFTLAAASSGGCRCSWPPTTRRTCCPACS